MKATRFIGDSRIVLLDMPAPQAKDDWVVVRVKASALCGTDLPFYHGHGETLGECIPGHEIAGQVVAVDKPKYLKVGARVVLNTQIGCGHCRFCRSGAVLFCPEMRTAGLGEGHHGGQAEFVTIPEKDCLPLPDDISYDVGSVIPDGVGVPYHLIRRMGFVSGLDKVAVLGAGPIGLGMVTMLKHMGAQSIIVSEPGSYRRELAVKLGAHHALDPREVDLPEAIKDLTHGQGVDKVIDAASHTDITTNQAFQIVRKGGTVGLVGQKETVKLNDYTHRLIHKELQIVTSCGYNLGEYETLVEAVHEGLQADLLITHRYPLEEIQTAFNTFASGNSGKVVISRE
jgi:threonine dehydrogenase-like Zn-dependent dehydrogenase